MVSKIAPLLVLYIGQAVLGVAGFGSVQFSISFIDIFLPFIGYGYGAFGSIAIGRPSSSPVPLQRVVPSIVLLRLAHAFVAFLIVGACLSYGRYAAYKTLMGALSFLFISSAFDTDHLHSGTQTLALRNIFNVVSKGLCLLGIFLLVRGPGDLVVYGILAVMPNALVALMSLFFSIRKIPWERPRAADLRLVFRLATPFAITTILGLVIERFDVFFVEGLGGSAAVGLYAGPLRIVQSIATATTMVSAVFFSELVRIEDPKSFSRHVELSLLTAALVLVPVAVGAWFLGEDLLAAVFTATYAGQGPVPGYVLSVLATGVWASIGINAFGLQVLWLKDQTKPLNIIYLLGLVLGCGLATLLGRLCGVVGVAASVAIVKFAIAGVCYVRARRYLPGFTWTFLYRIVTAALIMAGVLYTQKQISLATAGFLGNVWVRMTLGAFAYAIAAGFLYRREWPHVLASLSKSRP